MLKQWAETAVITTVFLLTSLIIWPTFAAGLPCSDDNLTHIYRVAQIDLNWQQGAPWLQWGPDMLRGYGYPVLAFYAPLTYWLVEGIYLLNGDLSAAMRLALFGSLLVAGSGAYLLARRYLSPPGALVAGLGYMFAPYLLYDAIQRGSLPETLALALIPWALALIDICHQRRTGRWLVVAALAVSLMILSHNAVPFFGLGLALLWALLPDRPRPAGLSGWLAQLWPTAAVLLLGLGLTLFFWLPGLAELSYTQSRRPDPPQPDWPHFEQHMLPPAELVTWPAEPADPALLNPSLTRTPGLGLVFLGSLGLMALWFYPAGRRRQQLFLLALVTAVCLFFTLPHSHWWWENVGPLRFIHLPTRFLGPASLGLALLGGVAADRLWAWWPTAKIAGPALLLAAIIASLPGWPWLYAHYCPGPVQADRLELATVTTWDRWYAEAQAELLPRWVDALPPQDYFVAQYEAGGPVDRLERPAAVSLLNWQTGPGWDRYQLATATAVRLTYHTFYFPGWQMAVNGTAVTPLITKPHGLMAFQLPPGEHEVEIVFRATPIRRFSLLISLLLLLPAAGLFIRNPHFLTKSNYQRSLEKPGFCYTLARIAPEKSLASGLVVTTKKTNGHNKKGKRQPGPQPEPLLLCLAVVLALLGLKLGVDQWQTPLRADRFQSGALRGIGQPLAIDFSGEFTYLGFDGPAQAVPERPFTITQYWAPQREIGVPYGFGLYLVDEQGQVWQQPPARPFTYTDYPGQLGWRVGMYARDAYEISLLPGTPPGVYWLEAEAFRRDVAGSLLPREWPTGPNPARARVGQLTVTAVPRLNTLTGLTAETAVVDQLAPVPLDEYLTLAGWSLPDFTLRSGDLAPITLLWHAPAAIAEPYAATGGTIKLRLHDEAGQEVAEMGRQVGSDYPLTQWPAGALVREQFGWRVDPALVSGRYTIWLHGQTAESVRLGQLTIEAPERTFVPPVTTVTLNAPLDFAQLVGYTITGEFAPGNRLALDLVWQAVAATETPYRVFVHLRASGAGLVAQSDGEPQGWLRPTTGWLPSEYISDGHEIHLPHELPADHYSLFVGFYDPATGLALNEVELPWQPPGR
jgi:hypothetical protein